MTDLFILAEGQSESAGHRAVALRVALVLSAAVALVSCTSSQNPFPDLPQLGVTTQFGVENLCDIGISPAIGLSNVPDGTERYVIQMTNVDVLLQTPWRETIPLTSRTEIPEGAAKTYAGPCIGDNVRFSPTAEFGYRHRVEVLAESADGKPLAYGMTFAWVQSPYLAARRLRMQLQRGAGTTLPSATPGATLPSATPPAYSNFAPGPTPNLGTFR